MYLSTKRRVGTFPKPVYSSGLIIRLAVLRVAQGFVLIVGLFLIETRLGQQRIQHLACLD